MSLTSYRAAPPRGGDLVGLAGGPAGCARLALPLLCRAREVGRSGPGQRAGRGPGEPGGDLLFRVLRRSTIGAEGFHGRVRDGIGCWAPRCGHQAVPAPAGWLWGLGRVPDGPRDATGRRAGRGWEFAKAGEAAECRRRYGGPCRHRAAPS